MYQWRSDAIGGMDLAGLVDAIKSFFGRRSPQPAPEQEPTINSPKAYHGSGYNGGYFSGSSGGAKYPFGLSTQFPGVSLDHYRLRQLARTAMQDSPEGRAIVERKVDGIAGTGLVYEPTPDISVLGITQEQAAEWGKNVGARFNLYMQDKKQNRSETMTGYQAHRFYAWSKERDNDVFVRLYYSSDRSLQNPLQFEFIDPDQIRGCTFTTSLGMLPRNMGDGIERDSRGRETGYKVWIKDNDGRASDVTIKRKGPKSGRVFMLHGFSPEYAGQGRGYTKLAPILNELQKLTDFSLAHIQMAINQAIMTGWIVPSDNEDSVPVFQGNEPGGAGSCPLPSDEGASDCAEDVVSQFECYKLPETTVDTPGMFIQSLTKGADIKFGNPNAPATGYDKFTDSFLTNLSALTGTPLEVVQMKFGNSFSASRGTFLLHQIVLEIERADESADFLNPLMEMWMSGEISAGRISAPGWSDPRLRAAWLKGSWRGAPVPDIDPGKLAKARKDNLETGTWNIEKEAAQQSGMSAADNIAINNLAYEGYKPLPWSDAAQNEEMSDDDSDDKE